MTHPEFIKAVEEYYGEYPRPAVKKMLAQYLGAYVTEADLPNLFSCVLRDFSSQYRAVPDIAVIDKVIREYEIGKEATPTAVYQLPYNRDEKASGDEATKILRQFWEHVGVKKVQG